METETVMVETKRKNKGRMEENSGSEDQKTFAEKRLADELERLKRMVGMGYEVEVHWLLGATKHHGGKRLSEEVKGNSIFIYAEDEEEALALVKHGFAEWILNQHTKRYRLLINKLIELFEEIQYEEKEKIIEAITKMMANP